jgi:predicted dehydrogenase
MLPASQLRFADAGSLRLRESSLWMRTMPPHEPVQIGFIGESTRAGLQHLERLLVTPEFSVRTGNARDLIASPDVEVAWIAADVGERAEWAFFAIQGGKHVVVELPLSAHVNDIDRVLACATAEGRAVILSHPKIWDDDFQMARTVVEAGTCGSVELASLSLWQRFPPSGQTAGLLWEKGPAFVEQMIWLVDDRPVAVTCRSLSTAACVANGISLLVDFEKGAVGELQLHRAAFPPVDTGWLVTGSRGGYAHRTQYTIIEDGEIADEPQAAATDPVGDYYLSVARHIRGTGPNPAPAGRQRDVAAVLVGAERSAIEGTTIRLNTTAS